MNHLKAILVGFVLVGCSSPVSRAVSPAVYFPVGAVTPHVGYDYAAALGQFREPPLVPGHAVTYRYLAVYACCNAELLRLDSTPAGASLRHSWLNYGQTLSDHPRIVADHRIVLSPYRWQQWRRLVAALHTWDSTYQRSLDIGMLDGWHYILELRDDSRHQVAQIGYDLDQPSQTAINWLLWLDRDSTAARDST